MKRRNFFGLLGVLAIGPVLAQAPPIAQSPQAASSPPAAAMSQVTQVSPDALLEMQAQKDAWLFLLDVRTTFITLTALPLSLAIALLALWAFGLTVNVMTLGGLAVAIGELVDDAERLGGRELFGVAASR